MGNPTLLPFGKMKEILNQIHPDRIVKYEGALCSQQTVGEGSVSVLELKVVFEDDDTTGRPEPEAT